jgi:hypothetical protein
MRGVERGIYTVTETGRNRLEDRADGGRGCLRLGRAMRSLP